MNFIPTNNPLYHNIFFGQHSNESHITINMGFILLIGIIFLIGYLDSNKMIFYTIKKKMKLGLLVDKITHIISVMFNKLTS